MLQLLAVRGYRSLRELVIPLAPLNLITGANGCGKSNLYKALRLLADTAQGGVIASLAREGGMPSTLWAGPHTVSAAMRRGEVDVQGSRSKQPMSVGLGFVGDEFGYAIDLGLPRPEPGNPNPSQFLLDPMIKGEHLWAGAAPRPASMLVQRTNTLVQARDDDGQWRSITTHLSDRDSMLALLADPRRTPEMLAVREQIRSWRFYDHFRADAAAPARLPQVGTFTPVLGPDGTDLAAALQTIREIGDPQALDDAVADAFPGARVTIDVRDGYFEVLMHQHGLLRPLKAVELSDGTLRYLLWVAALLSPRPPQLLVLNEPETSLHPDLLPALGRLIALAAKQSQVIVVSHARRLVAVLEQEGCQSIALEKDMGETRLVDAEAFDMPTWSWPRR